MKSRGIAIFLALIFGGLGFHKFYLGRPFQGLLYFFFAETGIPSIIGLFEGIRYCFMTDNEFYCEYG